MGATFDPARHVRDDAVHTSIYVDPAIFQLEMERIYGRAWIMVGHESQVPRSGDWITSRVGSVPILLIRGTDGAVRGFHNRCSHRGARLCQAEKGSGSRVVCPYHGWAFDLDGRLRGIPAAEEYGPALDWSAHGLRPVARLDDYRGFLFASLAESGPSLTDFLGSFTSSIDDMVDRAPEGGVEAVPMTLRHRYKGNWKLSFENQNDTIHAGIAHSAAAVAAKTVNERHAGTASSPVLHMMAANAKPLSFFQNIAIETETHGHSRMGGHMGADYSGSLKDEYFLALAARHGEEKAKAILSVDRHLTLFYPSATFHGRYQTVRLVRPLAPDLTEFVGIVFKLKGAPRGTTLNALEYCNNAQSAFSHVITDDLEIYEHAQRNFRHADDWLPLSRGLNGGDRGRNSHPATSEAFIRNQYRAWSMMMGQP